MKTPQFRLAIFGLIPVLLIAFSASPALADRRCNPKFKDQTSPSKSADIVTVAETLYAAIKNREVGAEFPPEVGGLSLIPTRTLEELNQHLDETIYHERSNTWTKRKLKLKEISAIRLESWHEEGYFNVVVHYKDTVHRTKKILGSSDNDLFNWYHYLRAGIKNPALFQPLNIAQLPVEAEKKIDESWKRVKGNDFNTVRTLDEYKEDFGNLFYPTLKKLNANATWIDMGAGMAFAITEFLRGRKKTGRAVPRTIAIGYEYPTGKEDLTKLKRSLKDAKFSYIEGRQTLESLGRLPQADVITDLMGIFTYHSNPLKVFQQYVSILKPEGMICLSTYDSNIEKIRPYVEKQDDLEILSDDPPGSLVVRKKR